MKKVSALILALAMCTAMLTACGGGNSNTTASTGSAAPAPTTSAATSEAGADEGYKLVKEGTLTMATNAYFPPYEYYDGQDIIGIDADIAKAIADKMGLTAPFKSAKETTNVFSQQAVAMAKDGKKTVAWDFVYIPSEEWKKNLKQALIAYAADNTKWDGVKNAFVDGWKTEKAASE